MTITGGLFARVEKEEFFNHLSDLEETHNCTVQQEELQTIKIFNPESMKAEEVDVIMFTIEDEEVPFGAVITREDDPIYLLVEETIEEEDTRPPFLLRLFALIRTTIHVWRRYL